MGFRQWSRLVPFPCSPEVRPLPPSGVTRRPRYHRPVRHPAGPVRPSRATGLACARHRQGFPCCHVSHPACVPAPVPRRVWIGARVAFFPIRRRPRMFFSRTVPKGVVDSCCSAETCGQLSFSHVRCRATLRTGLSPAPPGGEAGKSFPRQVGSDRTDLGSEPLRGPGPRGSLAGPPSRCPRVLDGCPDRSVSTARPGARDRLWQSPGSISASVSSTSVSGEPAVGSPTKGRVSSGSGSSPGNTGSGGSLWKPPDGSTGGYTGRRPTAGPGSA